MFKILHIERYIKCTFNCYATQAEKLSTLRALRDQKV